MNFPYPDSRFDVELTRSAVEDLATAFLAYFPIREGHRVTHAEQILMYLLADDPVRNASLMHEDLYRIVVAPLVARYEVFEETRIVRITKIGFFPV